ncbi:unnamed protein product, partial [Thelazia callipaeda]|uniref:Secreted protein n=1 Tax=Thelazia callipaeda TaxID=103827 RepID=A0A0N5CSH9_THECL
QFPYYLFICLCTYISSSSSFSLAHIHNRSPSTCFSCASIAYLNLWNQLMHYYFPPKNFTDHCWKPDSAIGTVPCRGSCFILVEEIYDHCMLLYSFYHIYYLFVNNMKIIIQIIKVVFLITNLYFYKYLLFGY